MLKKCFHCRDEFNCSSYLILLKADGDFSREKQNLARVRIVLISSGSQPLQCVLFNTRQKRSFENIRISERFKTFASYFGSNKC